MDSLYTARKARTGWFQLAIIVALTMISFYYIRNAFAKPFAQFETHNEIRVSEIRAGEAAIGG